MPNLKPKNRTKQSVLVMWFTLTASAGGAADLEDIHLDILPRTEAEISRVTTITAPTVSFDDAEQYERLSAGAATVRTGSSRDVFSQPSANMDFSRELEFKVGNALFEKLWVSSPSSTKASDGLGPLYNARSCQRCHIKDGRGHPPEGPEDNAVSMFLRISVPGGETHGIDGYHATQRHPNYGHQLQDFTLAGMAAEYRLAITYQEVEVYLSEGETASLRNPTYSVANPGYGPLGEDVMLSPRVAPQMIGLGLLEAIPAKDILANADPEDSDADGISGRANIVWSAEFDRPMLGRFGHKAGMPTVREQSAAAFAADIGISTPLFPEPWGDCTPGQETCRAMPHGDGDARIYEVDEVGMELVTFYSRNLAVPERRTAQGPEVLRGKRVFYETGCIGCHTPKFVTHRLNDQPEQSFQLIWPYTDLLLHDMGEGLADNRPEAVANGQEWRTPPLWGIGLTKQVSGHTYFLHDGRARNLLEAVLWHGGEAQAQRDAVVAMPAADRKALIAFLESL